MRGTGKNHNGRKQKNSLLEAFGKRTLDQLLKSMSNAMGISFFMIDYRGQVVAEQIKNNGYCEKGTALSAACQTCFLSSAYAAAKAAIDGRPTLFRCPEALVSMALPIIVNEQYLGAVIGGRVRCDHGDTFPVFSGEDSAALWEKECASYEQVKNVSREKLAAYSELSFTLLKEMGDKKTCALKLAAVVREETHIHELRKSIAGLKKELEQKEGEVLKARLLPQFLMNLFVTVSNYSVLEGAEKTAEMIADLSMIFRYYIDEKIKEVFLGEELKQIALYLKTLSRQYGEQLNYEIHCEKEAEKTVIPVLTIFPFVSYLLGDGVLPGSFTGKLSIRAEKIKENVNVILWLKTRNGNPLVEKGETISSETVDLLRRQMKDARKRLSGYYGGKSTVEIEKDKVTIQFPEEKEGR